METERNKAPVHEIRIGAVKVAVWENGNGKNTWFNVTLTKVYRDGDAWKSSSSFGRDDLLVVAKVADEAHSWICSQKREREE